MKNKTLHRTLTCAALAAAMIFGFAPAGEAKHEAPFAVSGYAGVNVWVEGGDVFNDYGDVTMWLRAERDCYTSLWLVDTAGFIHVLNPRAACDDGWVRVAPPIVIAPATSASTGSTAAGSPMCSGSAARSRSITRPMVKASSWAGSVIVFPATRSWRAATSMSRCCRRRAGGTT